MNEQEAHSAFIRACDLEERGEFDDAEREYRAAAEAGNALAQNNLGSLLQDLYQSRRSDEAIGWYELAFQNGNTLGALNLSNFYKLNHNNEMRIYWLRRAADAGDKFAIEELGI